MLKVEKLHKEFGGVIAVDKCSFSVDKGTITALIGPNGAGKTTVFNIITGYLNSKSGRVIFDGEDITELASHKIARMGLSRTFQLIRLFPKMSVMENIILAMPDHNEGLIQSMVMLPSMRRLEEKLVLDAKNVLNEVGLDVNVNLLAGNLSYGQQKLLEIAKAIAGKPKILLLDEPAAGVNPTLLKKIKKLLITLREQGMTILFVEHNMEFVMDIADKVVVLDYGKEIACDVPNKIQSNSKVIDAYLGVT